MKIAYVCNEYPPRPHGGIGTFVHTLAQGMSEAGHEVTVVGWGQPAGEFKDGAVRVVILPETTWRGVAWLLNRWRLHRWLRRAVRAGEIEVIESPEFSGLLPFRFTACPVVIRLHLAATTIALEARIKPRRTVKWCERSTLKKHRIWIAVSNFILERTQQTFSVVPAYRKTIYNPVPRLPIVTTEVIEAIKQKYGDYVLYASTVSERKGALALAQAAKIFLPQFPNLKLVYVGAETLIQEKPARIALQNAVGDSLQHRLIFMGRQSHAEVITWMRGAQAVVLPSQLEAFGLVPLEALACGVPVVYTKNPPGPEVINDGINGLLVNPNDPNDIADKIVMLIINPLFAKSLVDNAKLNLDKFSLTKCIDESVIFYNYVIKMLIR